MSLNNAGVSRSHRTSCDDFHSGLYNNNQNVTCFRSEADARRNNVCTSTATTTTTTTTTTTAATTTTTTTTATTTTTQQPSTTVVDSDFSWRCTFETASGSGSLCGMTQSSSDDFDWTLHSGKTPSSNTGPDSGVGGSGHYIYIEATHRQKNHKAVIVLPSGYQDGVHCLSFKYNMHGWHINKLQVDKRTASGQEVNLWTKERRQGPEWHAGHVQVDLRSTDQLSFIGTRGDEYSGDIALDNITLESGSCVA
ncbi:hypothetical protein NP493_756g00054 [Ridgeia piscesae]|uniref:MAM domain-containing protein n=1 Tax=Ridgeia piscesae TaxID=27915 RepID=A0AAD9KQY5_RIDPI|nr:hypothetical protein NP493_756g00054 [Ridgeia piscesae]